MDGIPILDYTPPTLLGIVVLLILFGKLVPWTVIKQKDAEIAHLRSTVTKLTDALEGGQETNKVVRNFFDSLSRGADL